MDLLDLLLKTQKQSKEHLEIQIRFPKPAEETVCLNIQKKI